MNNPVKIVFGDGSVNHLNDEISPELKRILLVTGTHVQKSGLLQRLKSILVGREITIHCGVAAEPPLPEVDSIIAAGRRADSQAVIAVGGGSVIDAAKAAAALIPTSGKLQEYFDGERVISGKGLFFVALPTTAGTGAELTPNAVLTDPATEIKKSLRHQTMFPNVAIIDPELLSSCSAALAANSGLDALTQAIESYISLNANATTREQAAQAILLLYRNLPVFCADRQNVAARTAMAEGSMRAALSFSAAGLGAVHGLGHPLGSLLQVPHGLCCAILLPHVLRWNQPISEKYFAELANLCALDNGADGFIVAIETLCRSLDIPPNFSSFGLGTKHFGFILENCRSNSMKSNPRPMSDDDVVAMLQELI